MKKLLILAALISAAALAQTTVTIPAQTIMVTIPAQTITLPTSSPAPTPTSTLWIYHNGVFSWGGDYSWGVTIDYKDTVGKPGALDIAVTGIGGFQPYATNWDFDPSPYKYLVFSLKPTINAQQYSSAFYAVGDIPTGVYLDVLKYGPAPVIGQWATYKIPLGAGGYQLPAGTHVYKFMIQDQTADQGGNAKPNIWYVDNVGFL